VQAGPEPPNRVGRPTLGQSTLESETLKEAGGGQSFVDALSHRRGPEPIDDDGGAATRKSGEYRSTGAGVGAADLLQKTGSSWRRCRHPARPGTAMELFNPSQRLRPRSSPGSPEQIERRKKVATTSSRTQLIQVRSKT